MLERGAEVEPARLLLLLGLGLPPAPRPPGQDVREAAGVGFLLLLQGGGGAGWQSLVLPAR